MAPSNHSAATPVQSLTLRAASQARRTLGLGQLLAQRVQRINDKVGRHLGCIGHLIRLDRFCDGRAETDQGLGKLLVLFVVHVILPAGAYR
mgnify:CR=1 FL=1